MALVEVNGVRLYYEESGQGEPVVQIHGSAFGRGNFATLTPLLSKRFRVIDLDLRGFGDSDAPVQEYSMELFADDVVGLLDALGLERAHVHGTSMGGMVGIPLAARYPDRVGGLVLTCSLAKYDKAAFVNKRVWRAIAQAYGRGEEFLDLMTLQLFSRAFLDQPERVAEARELVTNLIGSIRSPEVFQEVSLAVERADLVHYLGEIRAPTLVIAGRYDIMTPFRMGPSGAGSSVLAERIPGAELELFDTGHMFLVEQPEKTCETITAFLARVSASVGARGA